MAGLSELGVLLALDDFGTGYSTLAHLQRLNVNVLKIDRSFVEPLNETDTASESLVAAIVAMANALGIRTVAEGVETPEQARRLQKIGCEVAQGYMYARPTRVDQLEGVLNLLSTRSRNVAISGRTLNEMVQEASVVTLGYGA